MFDDLVAVIPARKMHTDAEDKIHKELLNLDTLLIRKIKQLRIFMTKQQVVVCTESQEIADLATNHGATAMMRDPKLSEMDTAISKVVELVAQSVEFDHIAWVPYVTPFFDTNDFIQSFQTYFEKVKQSTQYDSLISVIEEKKFFWADNEPLNYHADHRQLSSNKLHNLYSACNGNYMAPKQVMLDQKYYLGRKVYLDIKPNYCAIDIRSIKALHDVDGYQSIIRNTL